MIGNTWIKDMIYVGGFQNCFVKVYSQKERKKRKNKRYFITDK